MTCVLILDGEKLLILCRVALFFFTLTRKHSSNFFGRFVD